MLSSDFFFRRNLPHWYPLGVPFLLTYRLAGTLPRNVLNELEKERHRPQALPRKEKYSEREWQTRIEKQLFALWDEHLDKSFRIQWLAESRPRVVETR